nr:hypothetical protein [Tanacetum cinerariifolium]
MIDAKYNSQDEKAHYTILLFLSHEVLYEVADEETAAGVWKKLKKLYMTKSLTNKLLLKQRLFSLRMKEGSTLKDHLDVLNLILMDLKNVEVKIDDEDAALILLVSLPPSFENFVNSFVNINLSTYQLRVRIGEGHWNVNCPKLKEKGQVATFARDDSGLERDVVLLAVDYKGTPLVWIMDSACSFNMSPNRDWFVTYEEFDSGHVFMGNDSPCKVVGIGTIQIKMHDGVIRILTDVHHVPDLKKNSISLGVLDSKGETIIGSVSVSCLEKSSSDLTMLWHMRLGHMSEKSMVILSKQGLLDNHKVASLEFCEHCVIEKQKRVSFSKAIHQTKATLNYLHANCWGPSRVPSLGGARHFLSIIDDFSRMIEFNDFCKDEGIARHYMVRYTPQQNEVAERINRTLLDKTRCLLLNAELDKSVWAEALNTTCYLINSRDMMFDEDYLFRVKQDTIESKLKDGVSRKVEDVPKQVEH